MDKNAAIGIMDSGLGGLTVLKELRQMLPKENFLYFGDNARAPYGSRPPEQLRQFMLETLRFFQKNNVKMVVIACNTTTALGLETVKGKFPFLFVGMNKGVADAAVFSKNKKVGVIATQATIDSGMHAKAIAEVDSAITMYSQPCPKFVPLIEQGKVDGEEIDLAVKEYITVLARNDVDTVILGCTHYPFIQEKIKKVFSYDVVLIDPARATAVDAVNLLKENNLFSENAEKQGSITLNFSKKTENAESLLSNFLGDCAYDIMTVNILEDTK